MHSPSFVLVAALAAAQLVAAGPPACLLAAVGIQPNPADIPTLCGSAQPLMLNNLTRVCAGVSLNEAYDVYADTCLTRAQVSVSALPSPTSTSGSSSGSGSGSGSGSSSGSGSGTGSGSDGKNAAQASAPQPFLIFAISGLLATGLGGLVFL